MKSVYMYVFVGLSFLLFSAELSHTQTIEREIRLMDLDRSDDRAYFVPRHRRGDGDYHNHIEIDIKTELRITEDERSLEARTYMNAKEGKHDWTEARGTSEWKRVYRAPTGFEIRGIYDNDTDDFTNEIVDSIDGFYERSCCVPFREQGNNFVKYYKIWGDFDGDEAGSRTGVSVYFDRISITMRER